MYDDSLPDNFECIIGRPDARCGAKQGRTYTTQSGQKHCSDCRGLIRIGTDLDDMEGPPTADPYTASDEEDDGGGGETPTPAEDVTADIIGDTPEEKYEKDIREKYLQIGEQLSGLGDEALVFRDYIAQEFGNLVGMFMYFSPYGPVPVFKRRGSRVNRCIYVLVAYAMRESSILNFKPLGPIIDVANTRIMREALFLMRKLLAEDENEADELIRIYGKGLGYTDEVWKKAREMWDEDTMVVDAEDVRAFATIWVAEVGKQVFQIRYTVTDLSNKTGIDRRNLSARQKTIAPSIATLLPRNS